MTWPGLVRRYNGWQINDRPPSGLARQILDEIEVGDQAAKVWAWGDHYCPPESYARLRRAERKRAGLPPPRRPRAAKPPAMVGQGTMFDHQT